MSMNFGPQIKPPILARHSEVSMVFSADDDGSQPTPELISLALKAAHHGITINLEPVASRTPPPHYPQIWPGEHYKLLAGLVLEVKPKLIVEIGTGSGMSALAMKSFIPAQAKILTFDIVPWQADPQSILKTIDFADGRLIQKIDDLSDPRIFEKHRKNLSKAELILVDAVKDGVMEERLIKNFQTVNFLKPPIVVFDDIRLWNMLKIWRAIVYPKLDLTSFGHWSGTGLVHWYR